MLGILLALRFLWLRLRLDRVVTAERAEMTAERAEMTAECVEMKKESKERETGGGGCSKF
eukprot:6562109-Ditylum_brightwellii.AAC.1